MDWETKTFTQVAVFSAARESILAVAGSVAAELFGPVENFENTAGGLAAQGHSTGRTVSIIVNIAPAGDNSQVTLELRVPRAGRRGFMLFDAGGYYDIQLGKWLAGITQRLGQQPISRSQPPLLKGCLAGCLVYLVVGVGLAFLAIPLDRLVFLPAASPLPGPATLVASGISILAGLAVLLYVRSPNAAIWNAVRGRVQDPSNNDRPL